MKTGQICDFAHANLFICSFCSLLSAHPESDSESNSSSELTAVVATASFVSQAGPTGAEVVCETSAFLALPITVTWGQQIILLQDF